MTASPPPAFRAASAPQRGGGRALLATFGGFSFSNDGLVAGLNAARPDLAIETFDVAAAIRRDPAALLRCVAGAMAEYGPATLRSKARLRYRVLRSGALYRMARRLIAERVARGRFDLTLQTQSLFNAAVPGIPNYVYTDHVARQRGADAWSGGTGRPSDAWLDLERAIYDDAAHVFVFGSPARRVLTRDYGIAPDRVSVVGGGAPPATRVDATPQAYARRRILFVGLDWERKGGPELLRAFAAVRARLPDATLTVVGSRPEGPLPEGCEALGRQPREALDALYRDCTCFCMPSRLEPYGIVFLEAMHHARPVVATRTGAIPDIVSENETGLLVPVGDADALAHALLAVLGDPERARRMGATALERARGRFTWDAVGAAVAARFPAPASATASATASGAAPRPAAAEA